MSNRGNLLVKKVAVVSHNYNLMNRYGHRDFAEHFSQINNVCDNKTVDTILYSLFTWDDNSPVKRTHQDIFSGLMNVKCIIIEVGNQKSMRKIVEVWLKGEQHPLVLEQYFAKSSEPPERKREFIYDIRKRVVGNGLIVICGESNIANFVPSDGTFKDVFGFNDILKSNEIKYVFNPLHDYMTRYEMKKKRSYYSNERRAVITVWNQGKRKGEAPVPWTFFYNGDDLSRNVHEVSPQISGRPDIRIGIIPEII